MKEAVLTTNARPGVWALIGEDVDSVFDRDPAARTGFEVYMTYPGVHAVILYRLAHPLWRRGLRFLPRFMSYIARIWTSIDIHPGATIGRRFFIDHGAGVVIGNVPDERTVVGIPAKVVRTKRSDNPNPHGVDLDHHLIPDPVAGAITCLLDRIRLLEQEVGVHGCLPGGTEPQDECRNCDAQQVCEIPKQSEAGFDGQQSGAGG